MLTARKFLIPALAAALALAFTAGAPAARDDKAASAPAEKGTEEAKAKKKKRSACAFRRAVNGFSVIDDKHFVLDANGDFLVTLSPGCHNLDFEMAIAIKSTPSAGICIDRGDRVILDDHYTCWIVDIEPVENREEARKLVEERTKPKDGEEGKDSGKDEDGTEDETPN